MNTASSKLESKIEEMRRLFDESFAVAPHEHVAELEPMLAITVDAGRYAIPLREISGLAVLTEKIVPVPSRVPELLGLTGVRGIVVPVFDLAGLLGLKSRREQVHWLAFCGERQSPIALAFETMERMFEVPNTEIVAHQEAHGRHIPATLRDRATLRGLISISALVERIKTRGASERRK
jgi:purine-binding chemotaxis protein CheW